MSPEQRLIELTLLGIRWSLIHSGVNGNSIKIHQSRIFVNNKLYCTCLGSTFRPTCTSLDNPIESSKHQPLWVTPTCTCDKVVLNHTDATVTAHPTSAILSKDSGTSLSCDWLFSCLSFIFRSLLHKLSSFQSFVYSFPFKVIGVVETWFTSSIFDNKILPPEFSIFCKDRPTRGGGVSLAVHKHIYVRLVSSPNLEVISVQCFLKFSVIICIVYSPP